VSLRDKVAVVTGSGRGIGRSIALGFAREGAIVVVNALHDEHSQTVKKEIESMGGKAMVATGDVSRGDVVREIFSLVRKEFGGLDILVNNAGINIVKPSLEMTDAEWDSVQSLNLKAAFVCCRAGAPLMISRKGGRIINIASVVGINPFPNRAPYSTSKAALIMLSRELALEWAKHNILVNSISPGFFLTDLLRDVIARGVIDEKAILKRVPLGRFGELDEIAELALFLASSKSAYITGQNFVVDGGYTANGFVE
jgi:3-oxoacyl-[acyl-carrier protein] reductase